MAEILPDGTMQGYYNICKDCRKTIEVNIQGTPINHKCEVKNLDIPHIINLVCPFCEGSQVEKVSGENHCPYCDKYW